MSKTITAVYDDIQNAHDAVRDLKQAGSFSDSDISLISLDADNRYSRYLDNDATDTDDEATITEASAGAGATAGAVVGALTGLLLGTSVLVMPGVGAIVALGPIGATLAGSGIGAALGGLTGALVGMGIDQSDATLYREAVRRGSTLLIVRAGDTNVDRAVEILDDHHPVDVDKRADHWRTTGWSGEASKDAEVYNTQRLQKEHSSYPESARSRGTGRIYSYTGDDTETYTTDFQNHFKQNPPADSRSYNEYAPAYMFGMESGRSNRYADMDWNEAQAELHKKWAEQHDARDEHWDEVKDRVQYAWHKVKAAGHRAMS